MKQDFDPDLVVDIRDVYSQVYKLVTALDDPRFNPFFQTVEEIRELRRYRRVTWHRIKKMVRMVHGRGNSVPRALWWMWICGGVYFVTEMTPEMRQRIDFVKATWCKPRKGGGR